MLDRAVRGTGRRRRPREVPEVGEDRFGQLLTVEEPGVEAVWSMNNAFVLDGPVLMQVSIVEITAGEGLEPELSKTEIEIDHHQRGGQAAVATRAGAIPPVADEQVRSRAPAAAAPRRATVRADSRTRRPVRVRPARWGTPLPGL